MADISQFNINNTTYNIKDTEGRTQVEIMPTASADLLGKIYQFVGATGTYTNGYFYKCVPGSTSGTYEWVSVAVQSGGGGSSVQSDWNQTDSTADDYIKNKPDLTLKQDVIQYGGRNVPTASAENKGKVIQYTSNPSIAPWKTGWFYICELVNDGQGTEYYDWRPLYDNKITGAASSFPVTSGAVYTALQGKVDAVSGKGLSTNDYTTAEQTKLSGIATGATANTVIDTTVTISASNWSGSSAPYTATKSVSGILSTDKPIIDIVVSSTTSTGLDEIEQYSYISRAETSNGSITFYCYEDKPDISLTIAVKVVR